MLHIFHTYVASILSRRCIFEWPIMTFQVFLQLFQMHISNISSAQTYVANVLSRCFKSISGVVNVAMTPVAGEQRSG
jgi:hypothetical protein